MPARPQRIGQDHVPASDQPDGDPDGWPDLGGGRADRHRGPQGQLHVRKDKDIARQRSRIGMVFQRFNLFPHMTALENVMEAPVKVKRQSKADVKNEALELLDMVGLADRARYYRRSSPAGSSSGSPSRGPWP